MASKTLVKVFSASAYYLLTEFYRFANKPNLSFVRSFVRYENRSYQNSTIMVDHGFRL